MLTLDVSLLALPAKQRARFDREDRSMGCYGYEASRWQACANFYRDLSKRRSWSQQAAMVEFVERIAPDAVAREICAVTSHQRLLLQKFSAHFLEPPFVVVCCFGYRHDDARFALRWVHRPEDPVKEEIVDCIDDALWQRMVAWLERRN